MICFIILAEINKATTAKITVSIVPKTPTSYQVFLPALSVSKMRDVIALGPAIKGIP